MSVKFDKLSDKAKRMMRWIQPALDLMLTIRQLDEELFQYRAMVDEYDEDWLDCAIEDVRARRAEADRRLSRYRLCIMSIIRQLDFSTLNYTPRMQKNLRQYAHLRFFRGLPITSKRTVVNIENKMNVTRAMLNIYNRIVLNAMAKLWDENTPPI